MAFQSVLDTARSHARRALRTILTSRFALIWLLAIIPFVMVTPFAVLAYCAFMLLRPNSGLSAGEMVHLALIGGVALVNLKLSYDFSQDAIYWLISSLREWRDWLLNIRPSNRDPSIRNA